MQRISRVCPRPPAGVTLIELMVGLTLIGILLSVGDKEKNVRLLQDSLGFRLVAPLDAVEVRRINQDQLTQVRVRVHGDGPL